MKPKSAQSKWLQSSCAVVALLSACASPPSTETPRTTPAASSAVLPQPSAGPSSIVAAPAPAPLAPLPLLPEDGDIVAATFVDDDHLVLVTEHALLALDLAAGKLERTRLPEGARGEGAAVGLSGARAVVPTRDGAELWDLSRARARSVGTLVVPPMDGRTWSISRDGAHVTTLACSEGRKGECRAFVFSGRDGHAITNLRVHRDLGIEGAEVAPGDTRVSEDGRYLLVEKSWHAFAVKLGTYEVSTGRELLLDPDIASSSGGARVAEILPTGALLMSRHDGARLVDLQTGRTTASHTYRYSSSPDSLRALSHTRIPGTASLATVWGPGPVVAVWDSSAKKVTHTFDLRGRIDPCPTGCTLTAYDTTRLGLIGGSRAVSLDLATDSVEIGTTDSPLAVAAIVDAARPSSWGVIEAREGSCTWKARTESRALSPVVCADVEPRAVLRGTRLAGFGSKALRVVDLSSGKVLLAVGLEPTTARPSREEAGRHPPARP